MSARCVCGHPRGLHRDGVCFAKVNPCGCNSFETAKQAQKPTPLVSTETYNGRYAGRGYSPK